MGKRKNKRQDDPFNNEEEEEENDLHSQCPHIVRAVHLASIKKALKECGFKTVSDHDVNDGSEEKEEKGDETKLEDPGEEKGSRHQETSPEISCWLCMRSGHQGFDTKDKKQSHEYYKVPRSDLHCIFLNTNNWTVWCYECDVDIKVQSNKKIKEAVDFIRKQSSNNKTASVNGKSKPSHKKNFEDSIKNDFAIQCSDNSLQSSSQPTKPEKNKTADKTATTTTRVRGLSNLGNTCYFNSVMQCLSRTPCLPALLKQWADHPEASFKSSKSEAPVEYSEESGDHEIPTELRLRLSEAGPVMASFSLFVEEMTGEGKKGVFNPGALLGQISKRCPKFRGRQQEDSHELLRNLIELLRIEEAKRQKAAILKHFGLPEQSNPKSVTSQLKKQIHAFTKDANNSVIDKIFSGQIVSTIVCRECFHSSVNYEEVLDLSLSISGKNFDLMSNNKRLRPKRFDNKNVRKDKGGKKGQKRRSKGSKNNKDNDSDVESGYEDVKNEDSKQENKKEKDETEIKREFLSTSGFENKVCPWTLRTLESLAPVRSVSSEEMSLYSCLNDYSQPELLDGDNKWACDACTKRLGDNDDEVRCSDELTRELEDGLKKDSDVDKNTQTCLMRDVEGSSETERDLSTEEEFTKEDSEESEEKQNIESPVDEHKKESEEENLGKETDAEENKEPQDEMQKKETLDRNPTKKSESETSEDEILDESKPVKSPGDYKKKKSKTVYSRAQRQVLFYSPPPVLTLHLKRFQQTLSGLRKIDIHVTFPLTLDLMSYCSTASLATSSVVANLGVKYSLYGIVEHSGSLFGGHYVAYVKAGKTRTKSLVNLQNSCNSQSDIQKNLVAISTKLKSLKIDISSEDEEEKEDINGEDHWYCVSDSHVSEVSEERVLKSQAYLLFYERIL